MDKIKLLLVGGGGHCHSVIESVERTTLYEIIGICDIPTKINQSILGYKVIATDDKLPALAKQEISFLVSVGQIKNPAPRIRLFDQLDELEVSFATIEDPFAIISKRAIIGKGSVILRNSFVNAGVIIGNNCIINTGAIIEHDTRIGNHVHISTGAIVNGDCVIEDQCFIGSGAIISNGISVCSGTLVGAGAVVLRSISTPGTYLGNPARKIK